jgi:hypothetical protein
LFFCLVGKDVLEEGVEEGGNEDNQDVDVVYYDRLREDGFLVQQITKSHSKDLPKPSV